MREDFESIRVMGFWYWFVCRIGLYRFIMIFMHRRNLHYAPIIGPITGDANLKYQRWCRWCGFRESYRFHPSVGIGHVEDYPYKSLKG